MERYGVVARALKPADLATIRDLIGHSSTKMASDYTQTSLEKRRRAIEAMSLGNAGPITARLRQNVLGLRKWVVRKLLSQQVWRRSSEGYKCGLLIPAKPKR